MTAAAIAVDGLVKRYGGRAVVDGASLEVHAGEIVALLGPNGAGKTTTVEILEGYRRADTGTVRVLGEDPATGGRALRARVGLMLQDGGLEPRARPRELLRLYARFHADPLDPDGLLETVGLGGVAGTPVRRLSGGERQRLSLALALIGRPEVAILDEPTAGLDPEGRAAMRRIVTDLRDGGAAVLLTSHDLADVERMADRIVILVSGRVAASGTPGALADGVRPGLRVRLDRALDDVAVAALGRAVSATVERDGDTLIVRDRANDPALVAAVTAWCADAGRLVVELRTTAGSLEEAYLALASRGAAPAADPAEEGGA